MTPSPELAAGLNGIDVAYAAAGAGRSAVLVHGLAQDRQSWRETQLLLPEIRTYAYDLRGHGVTSIGQADGTVEQLAHDLLAFLERVSGPAVCVGFSLGGTVVLSAAATCPELVEAAVVLGTSSVVGRQASAFYDNHIALASTCSDDEFAAAITEDTRAALAIKSEELDVVVSDRVRACGDRRGYVNGARAMRRLHDEPLTPRLSDVRCHVDVVGGERDTFCPRRAAEILIDSLPACAYHEIPGVGHLMAVDDPQAVAAVLATTITKVVPL